MEGVGAVLGFGREGTGLRPEFVEIVLLLFLIHILVIPIYTKIFVKINGYSS